MLPVKLKDIYLTNWILDRSIYTMQKFLNWSTVLKSEDEKVKAKYVCIELLLFLKIITIVYSM